MGTEYCHGLFVADLSWKPTQLLVDRMHSVLRTFKLAKATPKIPKKLPENFHVDFGEVRGKPVVTLMGPSQYDAADSTRYLEGVHLVAGVDFQIVGPQGADSPIPGITTMPATWAAKPPKGKAVVWRTGIVFDCGKDLPAFAEDGEPIRNQALRRVLQTTLDTKIVEHGWTY